MDDGDLYARIEHPAEIERLLELLSRPGGAGLCVDGVSRAPVPVLLETPRLDARLCLDVSAVRDTAEVRALAGGKRFRVVGQDNSGLIRTPPLAVGCRREQGGRVYVECEFPPYFEQLQRRDSFRAVLRAGMHARVDVDVRARLRIGGDLRDLSLNGCLAEFEATAVMALDQRAQPLQLELRFPDGSHLPAAAVLRHQSVQDGRILCGFEFQLHERCQEQQIWRFVRETEREGVRRRDPRQASWSPSQLYLGDAAPAEPGYRTALARRLALIASFLAAQILRLRQGANIDSTGLSRHADQLLALQREDREGLLFALACLDRELELIRHCLAVAIRLVDMGVALRLPATVLKALAATGMVHDLGKAISPVVVREAAALDVAQREVAYAHVARIEVRLADCTWLAPAAIASVIEGANERLDGSGYPGRRHAGELRGLMRLAAIVDVADAMGRPRPGRLPRPIDAIYAHLRAHPEQFDAHWVERYIGHFGAWPVGARIRFRSGVSGWVAGLDGDGGLAAVRISDGVGSADTAGAVVCGSELTRLGVPVRSIGRN